MQFLISFIFYADIDIVGTYILQFSDYVGSFGIADKMVSKNTGNTHYFIQYSRNKI